MKKLLGLVAAALAMVTTPASAATFNLFNDFGASVFSYGTVAADGTFTAFPLSDCNDIGISQACYRGSDTFQLVAQRPGPSILAHPGPAFSANTAVLFTAPTTSNYAFDVTFNRADSGDGVGINLVNAFGLTPVALLNAGVPTYSATFNVVLTAGQSIGFALDRGPGNYFNDSTFVSGSVTSVPETATWAMMIVGFGLAGFAMRRAVARSNAKFDAKIKRIAAGLEA